MSQHYKQLLSLVKKFQQSLDTPDENLPLKTKIILFAIAHVQDTHEQLMSCAENAKKRLLLKRQSELKNIIEAIDKDLVELYMPQKKLLLQIKQSAIYFYKEIEKTD